MGETNHLWHTKAAITFKEQLQQPKIATYCNRDQNTICKVEKE